VEETLFRVAEEGLTNVRKHAQATSAALVLDFREGAVRVDVSDDGVGSGGAAPGRSGFGLAGLRERVERLNGVLVLQPGAGGGAILRAEVPA
jgi:signal transduction histidine kinase